MFCPSMHVKPSQASPVELGIWVEIVQALPKYADIPEFVYWIRSYHRVKFPSLTFSVTEESRHYSLKFPGYWTLCLKNFYLSWRLIIQSYQSRLFAGPSASLQKKKNLKGVTTAWIGFCKNEMLPFPRFALEWNKKPFKVLRLFLEFYKYVYFILFYFPELNASFI